MARFNHPMELETISAGEAEVVVASLAAIRQEVYALTRAFETLAVTAEIATRAVKKAREQQTDMKVKPKKKAG